MAEAEVIKTRAVRILIVLSALLLPGCSTAPRLLLGSALTPQESRLAAVGREAAAADENLHSLIVDYRGSTVIELYRNGWDTSLSGGGGVFSLWTELGSESVHDIRSSTKSVVALLAGLVLSRHPEHSLRSKVADFPELAAKASPGAQQIELGDLLGMTSGLSWREWGESWFSSDETALASVADPVRYSLDRPSSLGPVFNYSGGSIVAASRMLELIDGRPMESIAEDLFAALGISRWSWGRGSNGLVQPHASLGLLPRDMLKLGQLMLAEGNWRGVPVVPAEWVREITKPRVKVPTDLFDLDGDGTSYGYGWWTGSVGWLGPGVRWYSTVGNGGQKIFVVPQHELVVVMTAGDYGKPAIQRWETALLKRLLQTFLP